MNHVLMVYSRSSALRTLDGDAAPDSKDTNAELQQMLSETMGTWDPAVVVVDDEQVNRLKLGPKVEGVVFAEC